MRRSRSATACGESGAERSVAMSITFFAVCSAATNSATRTR